MDTELILYSQAITLAGGPYTPFFNLSEAVLKSMGSIYGIPIEHADVVERGSEPLRCPRTPMCRPA